MRAGNRNLAIAIALTALVAVVAPATGQDLQSKLEQKQQRLDKVHQHESVLSTTIQKYGDRIDQLISEISVLRNREALVQQKLAQKQAELRADQRRLEELHARLHRSLGVLRNRLVDIYRSGEPDLVAVILQSDGFDDLISRYEYLRRVEDQDAHVVGSVRNLRNETRATVERVTAERDEIAARKAELERTRGELESHQSALDAARAKQQAVLGRVKDTEQELDGDVSEIQDQIAAQVRAAQQSSGVAAPAVGPYTGPQSSQGFIWPVNGPVVSPFGPRYLNGSYENHPGIDIAVPSGTSIRAAGNGVVEFTEPEASSGGYGNFTCIDHGGGISTCYAHQSSFAVSQGEEVSQGQVIGISDCTGYCFGPHLHFEVRINGEPTDPIPYLP
jgi:murein DD-endopeptidase MepM/ murein hydrolase activator NlpD